MMDPLNDPSKCQRLLCESIRTVSHCLNDLYSAMSQCEDLPTTQAVDWTDDGSILKCIDATNRLGNSLMVKDESLTELFRLRSEFEDLKSEFERLKSKGVEQNARSILRCAKQLKEKCEQLREIEDLYTRTLLEQFRDAINEIQPQENE